MGKKHPYAILTWHARGSRRHPFAAFAAMLKTVQARDASNVGSAVRHGLQVLNLHKLCSGADTYGQGYAAHAVEPCLIVLLTDGCDMADVSFEPEVRSPAPSPFPSACHGPRKFSHFLPPSSSPPPLSLSLSPLPLD